MKLLTEQKVKILENRKKLIENILNSMNESVLEAVEQTLQEKAPGKNVDVSDVVDQDKISGDYWKNLNKKMEREKEFANIDQEKLAGDYWKKYTPSDEKAPKGFLSRLGKKMKSAAGFVDPSRDVDDPGFVTQNVVKSIKKTKKQLNNFKTTALNTTKNIHNLHTKITNILDKFDKFAETLPAEFRGPAEREVVGLAQKFYQLLDQEKGRIDSYMNLLKSDVAGSGREGALSERIATYEELENWNKMHEDTDKQENRERKTVSWGAVPSMDELEERMNDEDFNMKLSKEDKLAWDYAMTLAGEPYRSPDVISNSVDMYDVLNILIGSMRTEELEQAEKDMVAEILEEWNERYHDKEISETAESLASRILEVLGVEWV